MIRSLIRQLNSIIMAVLLAGVVWSVATSEANPTQEKAFPEAIPVETTNIPDGMVVIKPAVTTVRIRVRAPQANWDQLTSSSFRARANLQGLPIGSHDVPIRVTSTDPQVSITQVDPQSIGIRLEQQKTRKYEIHSDILDTAPPGFVAHAPTVKPGQVTVSGPAPIVDQVNEVVADVFLRGIKTPFDREVTLIPRDIQGNTVQGVVLDPASATVSVQIEQRVGYKDVSVKATLKGAPASGYWVSNIVVNPSTVTIVGNADVLANIAGFVETQPLDVTGATSDVNGRIGLALPNTVSVLNNEGISVQVSITPIMGGQTIRRGVAVTGLKRTQTAAVSPTQVDVILSGPVPTLQNLSPSDVQVTVDATGLSAGTYQLKPRVPVVPDSLRVQSIQPDSIQVIITDLVTVVPTLTVTPTATPTITSTPTITGTRSIPVQITPTPTR